jgi:hypothetical protein
MVHAREQHHVATIAWLNYGKFELNLEQQKEYISSGYPLRKSICMFFKIFL